MNLLEGEKILMESESKDLILTTCRIRQRSTSGYTSIFLEHICSIQVEREERVWLVIIGCIVGLGSVAALAEGEPAAGVLGLTVGTALAIGYFLSRSDVVWFRSPRASIRWPVKGSHTEYVTAFVDAVEAAKNARYSMVCCRGRAV